jgi:probable molybdopterin-guanine dinucleotide biosynthesis protein A
MPFISEECVRELYKFNGEYDLVVAADESHVHSLCGFFSADLASKAGELFAAGEHKIGLLRDRCRCKIVKFKDEKQFFNINYPSDYEEALMV